MHDRDLPPRFDLKRALLDPESVFDTPEDVLSEAALSDPQKVEVLRIWAYDVCEAGVALEEGMPGEQSDLLHRILVALDTLPASVDLSRTTSTKHHGIPASAVRLDDVLKTRRKPGSGNA